MTLEAALLVILAIIVVLWLLAGLTAANERINAALGDVSQKKE